MGAIKQLKKILGSIESLDESKKNSSKKRMKKFPNIKSIIQERQLNYLKKKNSKKRQDTTMN